MQDTAVPVRLSSDSKSPRIGWKALTRRIVVVMKYLGEGRIPPLVTEANSFIPTADGILNYSASILLTNLYEY